MDSRKPTRLPGNRVVRRRLDATRVITMPDMPVQREVPNVRTHAKRFVAGFTVLIVLGALLLMLPISSASRESTDPIDATFTAVSASAVTGLVTLDTATHWSFFGELVILVLIQLGGFGFMVGASLVLVSLGRGVSLRDTLLIQDGSPTLSVREATDLSKRILRFTLVTEAVGAVILSAMFMRNEAPHVAIWHGVFHSISAFCNAGFDLNGDFRSLAGYDTSPVVLVTIMSLIQAGALSFMVLSDVWNKRRWRPLQLDTKLVVITNGVLIVAGSVGFLILEWNAALAAEPPWARPVNALFQSVAARTAGFASVNFGDANHSTLFLWIAVMFIGGAAGSTAGGIKLATLAIIVLAVVSTLRGQAEPQAFGRRIATTLVFRSMAIIALFLAVHFALTLCLVLSEDLFNPDPPGFVDMMYETMSGMATVGLTTGITPGLSDPGKIVLCVAMFFGRLGPLTAAYALQRKQQHQVRYRYPEAMVRLG